MLLQFEFVAYAFYGGDEVYAQFLADFADVHIDGAVSHDDFRAPYLVEDLVAEEYAAGFGGQELEQLEFLFGEDDFVAFIGDGEFFAVDDEVAQLDLLFFRFVEPAEEGVDAGNEEPGLDGLGDVIVCPMLSPSISLFSSFSAVRNNTMVSLNSGSRRSSRQVSIPFLLGIMMSSMMRSGRKILAF